MGVGTVTITNLTRSQLFSGGVVYSHLRGAAPLFTPGKPASAELEAVAEEGRPDPLAAALRTMDGVIDVQTFSGAAGPIMPGETVTVEVNLGRRNTLVSLAAMLVTTNDAFVGLRGAYVSRGGSRVYMALAWDAGTEANSEMCAHIPGHPCGVHDGAPEGQEGYVYVSPGIRGDRELPAGYDWRNPVAQVTITDIGRRGGRRR